MTLEQIKAAVRAGKKVHWSNIGYEVIEDRKGQWFIKYSKAGDSGCIGLTHADNVTLNGREDQFFVVEPLKCICATCGTMEEGEQANCINGHDDWLEVRDFRDLQENADLIGRAQIATGLSTQELLNKLT